MLICGKIYLNDNYKCSDLYDYRRAPFFEGYKFREKSKSTFSSKLFSRINISARAATYMIMIYMLYFGEKIFV